MAAPDVSIIIAAYECSGFIGRAIKSVLAQDQVDLEVLIINDGSIVLAVVSLGIPTLIYFVLMAWPALRFLALGERWQRHAAVVLWAMANDNWSVV